MSKPGSQSAELLELEPWTVHSSEDVRRAWLDLQEYLGKRHVGSGGHLAYTYDEAQGLQVLRNEWRRRRALYLITNDEAPEK